MENRTILKCGTRLLKDGSYQGFVNCIINNRLIWSENTDILRTNHLDAFADASQMRRDIAEYNLMVGG